MIVQDTKTTLEKLISLLKNNEAFCYTRFGDSQLLMMDGWAGHAHEQLNNPKLQLLLTKAFQVNDPAYLLAPSCGYVEEEGMKGNTFGLYKENDAMVATVEKNATTGQFWHAEAIHYGMLYHPDLVRELLREINKKKVLIVAGQDLNVQKWFPGVFIGIPMDNAFKDWEKYLEKIKAHDADIVLLSCGLTSQVLQYFLFLDKPHITTINMGSVFNALLEITGDNIHTRGWIRDNLVKIQAFNKSLSNIQ